MLETGRTLASRGDFTAATANVSGGFQLSDPQATNFPQRFYRIQSP